MACPAPVTAVAPHSHCRGYHDSCSPSAAYDAASLGCREALCLDPELILTKVQNNHFVVGTKVFDQKETDKKRKQKYFD